MKDRTYIILSLSIYGINGAVQYLYNKYKALKKMGYNVLIFTGNPGNIVKQLSKVYITELAEFEKIIIPELQYYPSYFTRSRQDKIVNKIYSIASKMGTEYIVESNSIATAEWGEMLAKKLNAINFWFDLQETHNYTNDEIEFVKFKLDQGLIAGISPESIQLMLKNQIYPGETKISFLAHCSNSVQDTHYEIEREIEDSDIKIGCIGRLNKPYVFVTLQSIIQYICKHDDKMFSVILIGGAPDKDVQTIKYMFEGVCNAHLFITDYIYPIPRNLVREMNVFVSSSGSAVASMCEGVPTIVIDAETKQPFGILDYTVENDVYGENKGISLEKYLDMVLFDDFCISHAKLGLQENFKTFDYCDEVSEQLKYMNKGRRNYYDIHTIKTNKASQIILKMVGLIFGSKVLDRLRRFVYWKG